MPRAELGRGVLAGGWSRRWRRAVLSLAAAAWKRAVAGEPCGASRPRFVLSARPPIAAGAALTDLFGPVSDALPSLVLLYGAGIVTRSVLVRIVPPGRCRHVAAEPRSPSRARRDAWIALGSVNPSRFGGALPQSGGTCHRPRGARVRRGTHPTAMADVAARPSSTPWTAPEARSGARSRPAIHQRTRSRRQRAPAVAETLTSTTQDRAPDSDGPQRPREEAEDAGYLKHEVVRGPDTRTEYRLTSVPGRLESYLTTWSADRRDARAGLSRRRRRAREDDELTHGLVSCSGWDGVRLRRRSSRLLSPGGEVARASGRFGLGACPCVRSYLFAVRWPPSACSHAAGQGFCGCIDCHLRRGRSLRQGRSRRGRDLAPRERPHSGRVARSQNSAIRVPLGSTTRSAGRGPAGDSWGRRSRFPGRWPASPRSHPRGPGRQHIHG